MIYSACFDIGGTYIKYGVVTGEGEILLAGKMETPLDHAQTSIPEMIDEKIQFFKQHYLIGNIGISSCGLVDHQEGKVIFSSNIKGYSGLKLAEVLHKKTGLSVSVENDVRSACLGEMWLGAASGKQEVVLLTLGTGIGGAVVINGKLMRGSANLAGELGHMSIMHNGESCPCGGAGCLERYASTSALVRFYKGLSGQELSGKEMMDLVHKNDLLALEAYDLFLEHLVTGLVNIAHLYNPEIIIIGGGITEQGEVFLKDILEKYDKKVMQVYKQSTKLVLAQLHNDAALCGAYVAANQLIK
ncbi:ROK family protein [Lederbergia lenta]|uniref:Glucokinase n=1 Tax=Lederbergia lenta TaxID=1467 RepID=A0A2X4ZF51_LEDLE|nr:ROK family protein [Lederbergia lenta]MCM3112163.1 ROK family protein [Lederbergia lenta]MEC2323334.1 ROK family protein [Lederbergia lenta]SQI63235.1 glucokinase [Lederbergia lenta]